MYMNKQINKFDFSIFLFFNKTYICFESNSCDRRRFFIKLADEKEIGFMSSSNGSTLKTPNVFNDETFACGTVFG